ncbi:MAG: hypothetical protein COA78_14540 [Blastopirellula sp.]|nr:MAG: hypothetical protein COA78_14540 [Blastopirellula sp.]
MVVSRDGYILWARSSKRALRTGAFFRTANVPPVPIPSQSIAANRDMFDEETAKIGKKFGERVWFREECEELAIFSDQYDFVVSLLLLDRTPSYHRDDTDN